MAELKTEHVMRPGNPGNSVRAIAAGLAEISKAEGEALEGRHRIHFHSATFGAPGFRRMRKTCDFFAGATNAMRCDVSSSKVPGMHATALYAHENLEPCVGECVAAFRAEAFSSSWLTVPRPADRRATIRTVPLYLGNLRVFHDRLGGVDHGRRRNPSEPSAESSRPEPL